MHLNDFRTVMHNCFYYFRKELNVEISTTFAIDSFCMCGSRVFSCTYCISCLELGEQKENLYCVQHAI